MISEADSWIRVCWGKKICLFCHRIRVELLSWLGWRHSADGSKIWVCLSCEHSILCLLNLLTAWEPSHWVCTWKLCGCLWSRMVPDEDVRKWQQSSSCFRCGKPVTLFHTATDSCSPADIGSPHIFSSRGIGEAWRNGGHDAFTWQILQRPLSQISRDEWLSAFFWGRPRMINSWMPHMWCVQQINNPSIWSSHCS